MSFKHLGLTQIEADQKFKEYGFNKLKENSKKSLLRLLLEQILNPLVLVLILVSTVSLFMQEYVESLVIISVVILNSIIGLIQERKAENAVDSIKKLISNKSKVYRDGKVMYIDSTYLVPGDIVVLEAGDKVPADGVLIEEKGLEINESQLTGESFPVQKDQNNLKVFMSTIVTSGRGLFRVEQTGMKTEIGKITEYVSEKNSDKTPLEKEFKLLTNKIIILVCITCIVVLFTGLLKGVSLIEMIKTSVSLGVSSIPEGLPVVVTVTLAIGVYRMSRQNAIIKNLPSSSTLASVDVICTDKTGTITEGKIELIDTYIFKSDSLIKDYKDNHFIKLACLCNDGEYTTESQIGDLLDIAILKFAQDQALSFRVMRQNHQRINDIPFDSSYKYQATLNKFNDNSNLLIVKGAFDVIIEKCIFSSQSVKVIVQETIAQLGMQGYRVIVLASKVHNEITFNHEDITNLEFNGILVFLDPLRSDVHESIEKCQSSGIKIIMVTGDHKSTAQNIATQAKITLDTGAIHEGAEIREGKLQDERILASDVIARATPMDKVYLVESLNRSGKTIAMTGDGVNDAPALVKADIGIAMGEGGTDAAREAADMILMDNKFSTIVKGIEEARVVYENLKKVLTYIFSTSLGEIVTIFISVLLGLPLPLIAVQILWLNLITDGFLTAAMAFDKKDRGTMTYSPSRYRGNILDKLMMQRMFFQGSIMALGSTLMFQYALASHSVEYARTSVLIVLAMFQWFNAFNVKSETDSIITTGIFSNFYLILAVILEIFLLLMAVYLPFMQHVLETIPVKSDIWLLSIVICSTIIIFEEIRKAYMRSIQHPLNKS